jgi:hypothetical protein
MITRASLHVFGGGPASTTNRGGRPKVTEPRIPISTRISTREYDAIAAAARARGVTVAAFVRATLRTAIRTR